MVIIVKKFSFCNEFVFSGAQVSTEHASLFGAKGRPNGTIIGNARKEVKSSTACPNTKILYF